jgi:sulfonate transport system substrate-binding protein
VATRFRLATVTSSVVVLLALISLSACSGSSSHAAAPSTQSDPVANLEAVPAGTTLRFGDQLDYMKNILAAGGEDQGFPYNVKYASFVGGPPMLQAFQAGAIDAGWVADTPLIFAQAAHQDVVAVAAYETANDVQELIAAPGSNINSWADLKGKKVAYQQGTSLEAVLLEGLDSAGLSLSDIKSVRLPVTQVSAALQSGSVDAGILAPPLDSAYLSSHPGAKVVDRPNEVPLRLSFVIASKKALNDPAKAAAIRDYVQRLVRATKAIHANPDPWIQKFYVGQYHLSPAAGRQLFDLAGPVTFVSLPGDLVADQQKLADLYYAAHELPSKVDVSAEFDGRFNDAVQAAAG